MAQTQIQARQVNITIGNIPIGGIILWSGVVGEIPTGWALCDGSGGTPDLRDRFVVGAGSTYAVGDNGGAATNNLQHNHAVGTLGTLNESSHTHGLAGASTGSESGHTHVLSGSTDMPSGSESVNQGTEGAVYPAGEYHTHSLSGDTGYGSGHTHDLNGDTEAGLSHNHGMTGSSANAGSTTQENRPPYYALCYIMRTS